MSGIKQLIFYRHLVGTVVNDVYTSEESPKEQMFSEFCWSFFSCSDHKQTALFQVLLFHCQTQSLWNTQSLEAGCIFWTDSGSANTDKIKRITESPAAFSFTHNLSHIPHLHTSSSTNPLQGCCLVILRDSGSWRESGVVREQTEALLETLSFSINVTILLYVHGTTIKQTFRLC